MGMNIKRLFSSFKDAVHGVHFVLTHEQNFRIHSVIALIVLGAAFFMPLTNGERGLIILTIIIVLGFELVNTAIEKLLDVVNPRLHEQVKVLKDIMAGLVLLAAVGAAVVGVIIFAPIILE